MRFVIWDAVVAGLEGSWWCWVAGAILLLTGPTIPGMLIAGAVVGVAAEVFE